MVYDECVDGRREVFGSSRSISLNGLWLEEGITVVTSTIESTSATIAVTVAIVTSTSASVVAVAVV